MRFYHEIVQMIVPQVLVEKAKQFAHAVTATTNYTDSNQFSKEKIKDDHFISKIGEEAVKSVFNKYAEVRGPDYTIYEAKYKTWDSDLYIDGLGLAVKTQKRSSANRYTLSWIFQSGVSRKDKILATPDAWVCFVEYDDTSKDPSCYVYPPRQIKELIFREPVLQKLKGHKQVVYASDLK